MSSNSKTLDVFTNVESRVTDYNSINLVCWMTKQAQEILACDRDMKTTFRERVLGVCSQTLKSSNLNYVNISISGLFSSIAPVSLLIWVKDSAIDHIDYKDLIHLCERLKMAVEDITMQVSFSFPNN